MVIVAVANQKGGVGKTTTAVTLATAAAYFGKRALLVDLDPQAQCSLNLGLPRSAGVYEVVWNGARLEDVAVEARRGCDLLPATRESMAALQDEMVTDPWGVFRLADALAQATLYHAVLLDCPPTLGRLNVAAMVAADWVLVPTQCNYFGLDGLGQYVGELRAAQRRRGGPKAEVRAILPTFFDQRTTASREAYQVMLEDFDSLVAKPIPKRTAVERAAEQGQTVWEACRGSDVVMAYAKLAEWFYTRGVQG